MNLYLLKYNNYYNRIVKKENSLADYLPYSLGPIIQNVNFIPGDNVLTTQIVNWSGADPDYILVTTNEGTINSRWFVLETVRTRKGQLQLTLHRDLMVDYYDNIITAPCFIEKATIQRTDDPAIFNKENMGFNQIKRAQYPLQDESKTAWIVGYIPRDGFPGDPETGVGTTLTTSYSYSGSQYDTFEHLSEYPYYQYKKDNPFIAFPQNLKYGINVYMNHPGDFGDNYYDATLELNNVGGYAGVSNLVHKGYNRYDGNRPYWTYGDKDTTPYLSDDKGNKIFANFNNTTLLATISNQAEGVFIQTNNRRATQALFDEEGKIIKNNEDGQYYRVVLTPVRTQTITNTLGVGSALYNSLYDNINKSLFYGTPDNNTFQVSGVATYYAVTLELLATEVSVTIPTVKNRYHLNDSPYDMFAIPFPKEGQELSILDSNGDNWVDIVDRAAGFTVATSIAAKLGQGDIYDLQLLPYCPIREALGENNTINIGELLKSDIIVTKPDGSGTERVNVMFWCMQSQFHFQIPFKINAATTVLDKKVKSETELWRLCSPNYNGIFEFDLQKNNGIAYVDVDCTYKPFNPYIHMNPSFGGLYGYDWDDSRGLICGGDFSLPITTSAWADYELQNKNYQQMFDRQIQNMEFNNSIQKTRDIIGAVTGTVGGAASGAAAGGMIGGGVGMGIGAAVGTVTSAIGGIVDASMNEQLRNEALDYTKDQFGYQLGNIKALPQGLAKVSAFTYNNKIFPFIEQYQCTPMEIEALKNKLKYNGMTVMRVGTMKDFINPEEKTYIKGQLIRLEGISEDYHIINTIANEIYKGVFI